MPITRPFDRTYTDEDFLPLWAIEHFPILPDIEKGKIEMDDLEEESKNSVEVPEPPTFFWRKWWAMMKSILGK